MAVLSLPIPITTRNRIMWNAYVAILPDNLMLYVYTGCAIFSISVRLFFIVLKAPARTSVKQTMSFYEDIQKTN